jgi:hypothetical protein
MLRVSNSAHRMLLPRGDIASLLAALAVVVLIAVDWL